MTSNATLRPAPSPHHGKRMSLAEFEALPEEKPYLEYWDGVVLQKAVPRLRYGNLELRLGSALLTYSGDHAGFAASEVHVWFEGRGYLVPDVAYWAAGKPQGTEDRSLPPTLAIEIRSPDQSLSEQHEKCRHMRANGVDVCWLIDPVRRTAEVFDDATDGRPESERLESGLLPGLAIDLADLFAGLEG